MVVALRVLVLWLLSFASGASAQTALAPHSPPPRLTPQYSLPRPPATLLLPVAATVRLAALSLALNDLAPQEEGLVWRASLQLGIGAGFGVTAGFVHEAGLRASFSVASAISIARGIAMLTIRAPTKENARSFDALVVRSKPEAYAKIRMGERALALAARKGRTARIVESSITIVGAAAYLPTFWLIGRNDSPPHQFGSDAYDYVGLSLSVIAFATGLVHALLKGPAERHYDEYRALRQRTQLAH